MLRSTLSEIPTLSKIPPTNISIKKVSGLTNQNYLITTPDEKFILRIPNQSTNKYINRIDESTNTNIAYKLGISPKTVWRNDEGISLTQYIENSRVLRPSDLQNPKIQWMLQEVLSTLQNNNLTFSGTLSSDKIIKHLESYFEACSEKNQVSLKSDYQKAIQILEKQKDERAMVPSHIDLVPENMLLQGNKLWIIDWEYSAMASPFWDIATFCNSGNIDINASHKLLKKMLKNCTGKDLEHLKNYQHIAKSMSHCWLKAFSEK